MSADIPGERIHAAFKALNEGLTQLETSYTITASELHKQIAEVNEGTKRLMDQNQSMMRELRETLGEFMDEQKEFRRKTNERLSEIERQRPAAGH